MAFLEVYNLSFNAHLFKLKNKYIWGQVKVLDVITICTIKPIDFKLGFRQRRRSSLSPPTCDSLWKPSVFSFIGGLTCRKYRCLVFKLLSL